VPHDIPGYARNLTAPAPVGPAYSFCTLVSRPTQYAQMLHAFAAAGFTPDDCEFLYLDNSATNQGDGYRGLNRLIASARGRYIVLCHQDLLAIDPRARLDLCLAQLDRDAPDWAVVGNAGHDATGRKRQRLTDRYGYDMTMGPLPARVASLDENFLLIRRDAAIGFSHDLSGFHLYGTDLCLQADLRGRSAWVVDFHLEHLGQGRVDASFADCLSRFSQKYRRALRPRAVTTPSVRLTVGRFDPNAWLRAYKLRNTVGGQRPFAGVRRLRQWFKALPYDLRERLNGPRFTVGGTEFTIPPHAPLAARKALQRGTYELPERNMITKWLPRDLPVIELGGSYGIVSHCIRRHIVPEAQLVIVEANPVLLPTCTANVALAGAPATTRVIGAALAYGAATVRFFVTDGIHTSHLSTDTPTTGGREIEVPATSLAALIADHAIPGDFSLVCDIEGAEYDLLLHDTATLARCAMIVMEIHPDVFIDRGTSVTAFRQMLTTAGFAIVDHQAQVIVARR
jgi:FkbM family methyltransferase